MKTILIITLLTIGVNSIKGQSEAVKTSMKEYPMSFISKANAEKALEILKEKKQIGFNDHCDSSFGVTTLKKVWIEESIEGTYYNLKIKIVNGNGKKELNSNLDWIEIEIEEGIWKNLAKVIEVDGRICGEL